MSKGKHSSTVIIFILIALTVLARVIPHPPNVTPFLAVVLFSSMMLGKRSGLIVLVLGYLFSNILLGLLFHYPIMGSWVFVSLSGYWIIHRIACLYSPIPRKYETLLLVTGASCFYWIWTNLGVWLVSGLYPLTATGLIQCYFMAIPFLKNAVLGDLFWSFLLFYGFSQRPIFCSKNPS